MLRQVCVCVCVCLKESFGAGILRAAGACQAPEATAADAFTLCRHPTTCHATRAEVLLMDQERPYNAFAADVWSCGVLL